MGRIAWVALLRADFAEPPAESPSTMKISVVVVSCAEQSANFPGNRNLRVADLRATSFSFLRRLRSSILSIAA